MGIPGGKSPHHSKGMVVRTPDSTVPIRERLNAQASYGALSSNHPDHTRLVHHAVDPVCSLAYAVSQRGARRILYDLSVKNYTSQYDNMLREMCDGEEMREMKLMCLTTQPPFFTHWRPRGIKNKDSDINRWGEEWRDQGESENIRWSMRLNMGKFVKGEKGGWIDQYPD